MCSPLGECKLSELHCPAMECLARTSAVLCHGSAFSLYHTSSLMYMQLRYQFNAISSCLCVLTDSPQWTGDAINVCSTSATSLSINVPTHTFQGQPANGYTVWYRPQRLSGWWRGSWTETQVDITSNGAGSPFTLTDLEPATRYQVRLQASLNGVRSPFSPAAEATTLTMSKMQFDPNLSF